MTDKIVSAKQALLDAGRIKAITRGRISLDNHAWLANEAKNGRKFSDWPKGKVVSSPVTKTGNHTKVRVVRDPNLTNEKVIHDIHYTYPESDYEAFNAVTGKPLGGKYGGMREVCNTCRVSLVAHGCQNPTILGDIRVVIKARV